MATDTYQNKIQLLAFFLALSIAVCLSLCFVFSSISDSVQSCEIKLESQINPNYAPLASLIRLPGVGIVRAGAITAYRENFSETNNGAAFQNCDDLQKVKGIGPKTTQNISPWLKFK